MKKALLLVLVLAIVASGLLMGCGDSADTNGTSTPPSENVAPEVGKTAPDFTLPDLDGKDVTLSSFRGKPVLINFWATWCGPCYEEMPYFQAVYDTWTSKGLAFVSIDTGDRPGLVSDYMNTNGFAFPVLVDSDGDVALKYGIMFLPTTIILDEDGVIKFMMSNSFTSLSELEGELRINLPGFE